MSRLTTMKIFSSFAKQIDVVCDCINNQCKQFIHYPNVSQSQYFPYKHIGTMLCNNSYLILTLLQGTTFYTL